MSNVHDDAMPQGWHTIKSVLLKEIRTAANFHLCAQGADALFHARLIGESIARECSHDAVEAGTATGDHNKQGGPR